jgi:hypothetical protein
VIEPPVEKKIKVENPIDDGINESGTNFLESEKVRTIEDL